MLIISADIARNRDIAWTMLNFSLNTKRESRNAEIIPIDVELTEYTGSDISAIANTERIDVTLDIAVLVTTFNVVFSGNGRTSSFSEFLCKTAKTPKAMSVTATIITFVRINSEPESVAFFSKVKSFKMMGLAPEITKKARHTGMVALENFCFVPIYGMMVAITIITTEIIIVVVGSSPRYKIVNSVERIIDPLVESMLTSDTETNL